jgi:hypothetical protein
MQLLKQPSDQTLSLGKLKPFLTPHQLGLSLLVQIINFKLPVAIISHCSVKALQQKFTSEQAL